MNLGSGEMIVMKTIKCLLVLVLTLVMPLAARAIEGCDTTVRVFDTNVVVSLYCINNGTHGSPQSPSGASFCNGDTLSVMADHCYDDGNIGYVRCEAPAYGFDNEVLRMEGCEWKVWTLSITCISALQCDVGVQVTNEYCPCTQSSVQKEEVDLLAWIRPSWLPCAAATISPSDVHVKS